MKIPKGKSAYKRWFKQMLARRELFKKLRAEGQTLDAIGKAHGGLTRERVRQIVSK